MVVIAKVRVVVSIVGFVVAIGEGIVLEVEVPIEETWWTVHRICQKYLSWCTYIYAENFLLHMRRAY